MTFEPVVPAAILAVIGVAVIATRLITMRQLMNAPTGRATVLRWCGLTLALLLLLIAAARPVLTPGGKVTAPQAGQLEGECLLHRRPVGRIRSDRLG